MVSEQDAALPLAGRICFTVGKPERWRLSRVCCLCLSCYTACGLGKLHKCSHCVKRHWGLCGGQGALGGLNVVKASISESSESETLWSKSSACQGGQTTGCLELFLHHLAAVLQRKTQEETNLLPSLRVCVKQKRHAVLINIHMGQGLDELWRASTGQRSAQRQIQVELVMSKFSSRGYIPGFYIFHILWRQSLCVWLYVLEAISG